MFFFSLSCFYLYILFYIFFTSYFSLSLCTSLPSFLPSFISEERKIFKGRLLNFYLLFENNIQNKLPDLTIFEPPRYSKLDILDLYTGQDYNFVVVVRDSIMPFSSPNVEKFQSKRKRKKERKGRLDRIVCSFFVSPWKKSQLSWDALKHSLIKNDLSQWTLDCMSKALYKMLCGYRCISHYCFRKFSYLFLPSSLAGYYSLTEEWSPHWFFFLAFSPDVTFQFFFWNEIMITWKPFSLFSTIAHHQVLWQGFL